MAPRVAPISRSRHPATPPASTRCCAPPDRGTVLLMGIVHGSASLHFDDFLFDFIKRELTVIATFGFTRADFLLGNVLYEARRLDLRS